MGFDGRLVQQANYKEGELVSAEPPRVNKPFAYPGDLGADDFAFVFAQGSGLTGFCTLRISAAGNCEYFYQDCDSRGVQKKAIFQLADPMQRQLRDALSAADFFNLKTEYINPFVICGGQWCVWLRANGKEQIIFCSNVSLPPLAKLACAHSPGHYGPPQNGIAHGHFLSGWDVFPNEEWLRDP